MEGPRAIRSEEFASLGPLTNAVFRSGGEGDMVAEYPQLMNTDNFENLRVCVEDGRVVSHVGMTERDASLFGCRIRVACIGAVATYTDFRGRGLASACFDDAVTKAYRDGVDVMLISGDRGLYRRHGCLRVGQDIAFDMTEEQARQREQAGLAGITVTPMRDGELPLLSACYRQEPVRFLRPLDDYRRALECRFVMNRTSEFLIVHENGDFRGYLIAHTPGSEGGCRVAEFAGDRRALTAALPGLMRHMRATSLFWQVQRHDALFRSLCESTGLIGTTVSASGTCKLINFPQLMERMRPYFVEMLGVREAERLSFWHRDEQYGFRHRDVEYVTDRDTATRIVFGTPDEIESEAIAGLGALTEVLQTIFPLPCLWYGINYV